MRQRINKACVFIQARIHNLIDTRTTVAQLPSCPRVAGRPSGARHLRKRPCAQRPAGQVKRPTNAQNLRVATRVLTHPASASCSHVPVSGQSAPAVLRSGASVVLLHTTRQTVKCKACRFVPSICTSPRWWRNSRVHENVYLCMSLGQCPVGTTRHRVCMHRKQPSCRRAWLRGIRILGCNVAYAT